MQRFTPRQYLKIDIASNYGLSKVSWDDRLLWFQQNEHKLPELVASAKEPALFYAGMKAYEDISHGRPTGYMISLDATSSGLQISSVLTGDRQAASLCNVIDTGTREDAYKLLYEDMCNRVGDATKINHDDVKQAIMTAFYGSKAMPKQVFGEGALLNIFYQTLADRAPAAWELNEFFLELWNPDTLSHDWVLPDNFHVKIKVMDRVKEVVHFLNQPFETYRAINAPMDEGRSLAANTHHSIDGMIVREMSRRCDYDPKIVANLKAGIWLGEWRDLGHIQDDNIVRILWDRYQGSGYLSARIIEHLNRDNICQVNDVIINDLLESLPKKPFKVVSVHDCFRCHPNYGDDLRQQYNNQLMLIAKSNLLQYIIGQLLNKKVSIGKLDPNLWQDVAQANYALS